jgi:hypothetical protein
MRGEGKDELKQQKSSIYSRMAAQEKERDPEVCLSQCTFQKPQKTNQRRREDPLVLFIKNGTYSFFAF